MRSVQCGFMTKFNDTMPVDKFNDTMPVDIVRGLLRVGVTFAELADDESYGNGAHCLYRLIKARELRYQ